MDSDAYKDNEIVDKNGMGKWVAVKIFKRHDYSYDDIDIVDQKIHEYLCDMKIDFFVLANMV